MKEAQFARVGLKGDVDSSRVIISFFPIDIYGRGYSGGEPRPEREPLWFAGSFELEREMIHDRIAPCLAAARRIGMPVVYVNNSNPPVRADLSEFGAVLRRTHGLTDAERWHTEQVAEFEFSACVAPQPGDYLCQKVMYSGFFETNTDTLLRNLGSRFNDRVANVMLKKPRGLYLSSFKALNRFLIREIVKYDLPYPYIDGLVLRTTSRIGRLEVEHRPRASGRSGYTLTKLIRLWLNMFTNFSIMPLRAAILLGAIVSFCGLLLGVVTVLEKLSNPHLPVGYPTILIVVLLFSGIQLLSLGMIGEYIGRMFLSQNKKPQYTIRKRYEKVDRDGKK